MVRKFFTFFGVYVVYMLVVFTLMALAWKYMTEAGWTSHWPVPVALVLLLAVALGLPIVGYSRWQARPHGWQKRVLRDGQEASAQILRVADTGVSLGNADLSYFVHLTLAVQPVGRPVFTAELDTYVSRAAVPRAGDLVRIKFDPNDPTKVVLAQTAPRLAGNGIPGRGSDRADGLTAVTDMLRTTAAQPTQDGQQIHVIPLSSDPGEQLNALMETLTSHRRTAPNEPTDRIAKLDALRQRGVLTDDEYTTQRQRILDEI